MARLVVVSGPSGAGKTSLVAGLLAKRPDLALSLSATTRARRPDEVDGVHYRFLTEDEFERLDAEQGFLESAVVHGNRYGTPRAPVEEALDLGKTVILEIDVQGASTVRAQMPKALLVFCEPPSMEVLEQRLRARGTESPDSLAIRLANAAEEMAAAPAFDVRIVNDDLDVAVSELARILEDTPAATDKEKQ